MINGLIRSRKPYISSSFHQCHKPTNQKAVQGHKLSSMGETKSYFLIEVN